MKLYKSLLRWLVTQTFPVLIIALPLGCVSALMARGPLEARDPYFALFVAVHSLALVSRLARFRSPDFAFLYERGFGRNTLWAHTMLATAVAILLVWLPMALIVWTPLRGLVQDVVFRSPFYPLMRPREVSVPWVWLGLYAVVLPVLHYEWIRRAHPTRGGAAGSFITAGLVLVALTLFNMPFQHEWFGWLVLVASVTLAATALAASRRLHRHLEIRS
jgi:hypothetical protein